MIRIFKKLLLAFTVLSQIFFASCAKLSSFGVSAGPAFGVKPECTFQDNAAEVDSSFDTYDCIWQPPPQTSTTGASYTVHLGSTTDGLWETSMAQTVNTTYTVKVAVGTTQYFAVTFVKSGKKTPNYSYAILGKEGVGKAPQFAGIKDLAAASRNTVTARWEACKSNTGEATTCAYSLYSVVGGDTRTMNKVAETVDLSATYTDPYPGAQGVSYLVRARDVVSNSKNDGNRVMLADPLKVGSGYPSFQGIKTATVRPGIAGLSEGTLTWNIADAPSTVKGYQIFVATSRGLPTSGATQVTNPSTWPFTQLTSVNLSSTAPLITNYGTHGALVDVNQTEVNVVGLLPDTTYYFAVRAVGLNVTPASALVEENRVDRTFTTKAKRITTGFAGISALNRTPGGTADAFSTLGVVWALPNVNAPGVYDSYRVTYQLVNSCSDPFVPSAPFVTVAEATATSTQLINLTNGATYKVKVQARLETDAALSDNTQYLCQTVGSDPPTFTGITNAVPNIGAPLTNGFTQMDISFPPATGHNGYRVYITAEADNSPSLNCVSFDNTTTGPKTFGGTQGSPLTVTGLTPGCSYRFRMTAAFVCNIPQCPVVVNMEGGNTGLTSGIIRSTLPKAPDGNVATPDGIIAFSETSGGVVYNVPTIPGAIYNEFAVYKSEGSSIILAQQDLVDRANARAEPDDVISVGLGEDFTSTGPTRTYTHPTALTSFVNHCWLIQPRYKDPTGVYPTIWSSSVPTPQCKYFQIEAMQSFAGATSAKRPSTINGFNQIEVYYLRPHKGQAGWENHSFVEVSCSENTVFPSCLDKDTLPGSPPCPDAAKVYRNTEGPAESGILTIRKLTVENVPENKTMSCRAVSVNSRGFPNVSNGGNGQGNEPVLKAVDALPPAPGGSGMTKVKAISSSAIRVTVSLPMNDPAVTGGGLFSHVLIAVNRQINDQSPVPTPLSSAAILNAVDPLGLRQLISSRNVISTVKADLTPNSLFALPRYDITDGSGTTFEFDANDPNEKALLRFSFSQESPNFSLLGSANNPVDFTIEGLTANVKTCALAKAVWMQDTFPSVSNPNSHFLENIAVANGACDTPVALAPFFPTDIDDENQLNVDAAGIRLTNGSLLKAETTSPGSIVDSFDMLRVDLPAVTSTIAGECNGMEVAIFDAQQTKNPGETNDQFANRIFEPAGPGIVVPNRVEYKHYVCSASATTDYFNIGVDYDGNGVSLQRYGKYFVRARAYKTAVPVLSRGALLENLNNADAYLMPTLPGATNMVRAIVNSSSAELTACGSPTQSNCSDANLPARAAGDKFTAHLSFTPPAQADLSYPQYLNKVYIWRTSGSDQNAARAAVAAKAATKPDRSGPTNSPDVQINRASPPSGYSEVSGTFTYQDKNVTAAEGGQWYTCYIAKVVYADNQGRYLAGSVTSPESQSALCVNPSFVKPNSSFGMSGSVITEGTCSGDGSAKLKLQVTSAPNLGTMSYDSLKVYYSPNPPANYPNQTDADIDAAFRTSDTPWITITKGDATYDTTVGDAYVHYGCKGKTISSGYFHVRSYFGAAALQPTNLKVVYYNLSDTSAANYVFVPKAQSKLGYDFYMMSMEATVANPTQLLTSNDVVSTDPAELTNCNSKFHNFGQTNGFASDGTFNCASTAQTTTPATTKPTAVPANIKWDQAWRACRLASNDETTAEPGFRVRLPTQAEWVRAARWAADNYTAVYNGSNFYGNNCRFTGGVGNAGANTNCKSVSGMLNAAGNMREWVDARMQAYDMLSHARPGFGYTNSSRIVGRMVDNGLDRLTPLFQLVLPDAVATPPAVPYPSALLMGSGVLAPSTYTKQYDLGTESWFDLNPANTLPTDAGFRCVAFSKHIAPAVDDLELPEESRYRHVTSPTTDGDTPSSVHDWTVPAMRYMRTNTVNFGDYRMERISYSGNSSGGTVTFSWAPWEKDCTPSSTCTGAFKYHIYRIEEATGLDERFNPPWGVLGSAYSTKKAIDPLAINSSGNALNSPRLTRLSSACATSGQPYRCTIDDTISATDAKKAWYYVMVAEDDRGNFVPAFVQRFRTPHIAGEPLARKADGVKSAPFRQETRLRRLSLGLLDGTFSDSQANPQHLAWVPMHRTGLDHDFYLQKYEAMSATGIPTDIDGTNPEYPISAVANTNTWASNASTCYEKIRRTGVVDPAYCGNASNAYSTRSKPGQLPTTNATWGTYAKGCMNSAVEDGSANLYPMRPITGSERLRAADWGDLNLDGIVDNHPILTSAIENTEYRLYEQNGTKCYSTSVGATGDKPCVSAYGVYDLVGNNYDWAADRSYDAYSLDNGLDGLGLGQSASGQAGFKYKANIGQMTAVWDLWRAVMPDNAFGATYSGNPNGATHLPGAGGGYGQMFTGGTNGTASMWTTLLYPPDWASDVGGHCAF